MRSYLKTQFCSLVPFIQKITPDTGDYYILRKMIAQLVMEVHQSWCVAAEPNGRTAHFAVRVSTTQSMVTVATSVPEVSLGGALDSRSCELSPEPQVWECMKCMKDMQIIIEACTLIVIHVRPGTSFKKQKALPQQTSKHRLKRLHFKDTMAWSCTKKKCRNP